VRYVVSVNGQKVEVILDGLSVRVGGFAMEGQVSDVDATPVLLATVDARIHELRASIAGVVRHVAVAAGNAVEKGAVLIEFEAAQ
jgi:biotin carboxyl carrier protein